MPKSDWFAAFAPRQSLPGGVTGVTGVTAPQKPRISAVSGSSEAVTFLPYRGVTGVTEPAAVTPVTPAPPRILAAGVTEEEQQRQGVGESVTPVTPVTPTRLLGGEHAVGWNAEDWQAYFDERAGMAEYDGGVSRRAAERLAFENCISLWLDGNPEPSSPDCCALCGGVQTAGRVVIPYGMQHHTWLHPECWATWYQRRRRQAEAALADLGLTRPCPGAHDATSSGCARDGEGR
jgi:hypothetical protein